MDSFSWKNMCEHFIFTFIPLKINLFILSHAGKSGDVLCLAQSLNQIVASSGSRNVCVVSPLCSCATAALSHFPTGNLSKHLGFTIYIDLPYPQGLNVGSSIITATWRKITNQPAGCWGINVWKSLIITVGLLLCGCLQQAGLLHKLASSTLDQCQKRCNNVRQMGSTYLRMSKKITDYVSERMWKHAECMW